MPASSPVQHLFAFVVAAIYLAVVLEMPRGFLELLISTLVTWASVRYFVAADRTASLSANQRDANGHAVDKETRSDHMGGKGKAGTWPWYIFAILMGQLTLNHIHRYFSNTSLDVIEITGSQMVLVMKLSHYAWNAYDGTRPLEELDDRQKGDRITELPGLLEFLGFSFFFPSILVGPSFTFASYRAFTSRSLFASVEGKEKATALARQRLPKGRTKRALRQYCIGALYLALYSLFAAKYSYATVVSPSMRHAGWFKTVLWMNAAGFFARTKYYAVWTFAEAACIASGIAWNPRSGKYDGSRNVKIRSIEFAENFKILLDSWNMNTNVWLRECVYKRTARKGRKPGFKSTMATFATSALWHGININYFFTFLMGGFLQALGRQIRTTIRPFLLPAGITAVTPATSPEIGTNGFDFKKPPLRLPAPSLAKRTYDVLSIVATQAALNYIVAPFMLLELRPTLVCWQRVGWYGHIITFVPLTFYWLGGGAFLKGQLKAREKHAARQKGQSDRADKRIETTIERTHEKARQPSVRDASHIPSL
ncbi:uncharacterized protein L969DRAFT_14532 [Mixia osmundae IAM 14324]|nr:uncharacterized protein L969DRAFT_14532 [Mixia osmundae IAM 14324]KEI42328.1 hypothetical protein L969DRAFT_14532 [Mixia osmundae IAM 14324]